MQRVAAQIGVEQLLEAVVAGIVRLAYQERRERRDALTQVRAGLFAGLPAGRGDVQQVVGQLKRNAKTLAKETHNVDCLWWAATEHRAIAGSGRDEHAGLVREHTEVVVDRVGTIWRRTGVADLARAQPHERLRLDLDRLWPQSCDELGGLAEQQVAHQDRIGVAVPSIGADHAATQVSLIHDVVVVQRGEMGELHTGRRRDDVTVDPAAQLGGEQREHRPETLAPGLGQMHGRLRDEGVLVVDDTAQQRVDRRQPAPQSFGQLWRRGGHRQRGSRLHHRRNSDERAARSSSGPGTTPSTSVATTPMVTAPVVRIDGATTRTESPAGSEKYISTTTRT